jgi:hypothetical protein
MRYQDSLCDFLQQLSSCCMDPRIGSIATFYRCTQYQAFNRPDEADNISLALMRSNRIGNKTHAQSRQCVKRETVGFTASSIPVRHLQLILSTIAFILQSCNSPCWVQETNSLLLAALLCDFPRPYRPLCSASGWSPSWQSSDSSQS